MKTFSMEHRVNYKETDQMGVVYYANYLIWFEIVRTEYFRDKGLVYKQIEDERKIYLPVAEATCKYKSPARYDDLVTLKTWVSDMGKSKLIFEYEIEIDGKVTATGMTRHAFISDSGRPVPIPDDIRQKFESK